ncbi:MAG: IPT/TIG domain-containing protein [Actinomycetota bacterium]
MSSAPHSSRWLRVLVAVLVLLALSGAANLMLFAPEAFAATGVTDNRKIKQLIYPTIGNPKIIKTGDAFDIEWDPRAISGGELPTIPDFEVTVTNTNDPNPVTKELTVNSFTAASSTAWPNLAGYTLYKVNVTIPYDVPRDLYDLTVTADPAGTPVTDSQPNAISIIEEYKAQPSFIQCSDIHVYGKDTSEIPDVWPFYSHSRTEREHRYVDGGKYRGATYLEKTIDQINRQKPDFCVFTGDYDFGQAYFTRNIDGTTYTEYEYEQLWMYDELTRLEVPVYMTIGNHDGYHEGQYGAGEDWWANWKLLYGPLYYSFNYGPDVHMLCLNSMDWASVLRQLTDYFGIILQPTKYLGCLRGSGDLWNDGGVTQGELDSLRTLKDKPGQTTAYTNQLAWMRNDLAAHQTEKVRGLALHHDPWKDNGSGSMWASSGEGWLESITGSLDMGDGEGRLAVLQLMRDYHVDFEVSGHDHSDYHAVINWASFGGTGNSRMVNSTSTSFQSDGSSTEYPGYERVWIDTTQPAGSRVTDYAYTSNKAYPTYDGTNVFGSTNLGSLTNPMIASAWSGSGSDQTCTVTNHLDYKNVPDPYVEFNMPMQSDKSWYTVTGGQFADVYDADGGTVRVCQVVGNDVTGGDGQTAMHVYKTGNDTTPPDGSVSIADGAATTTSLNVTLNIAATDGQSGPKDMRIWNQGEGEPTTWEKYSTTRPWTLRGPGDDYSSRTVNIKFRDNAMAPNESGTFQDDIDYIAGGPPPGCYIQSISPVLVQKGDSGVRMDFYGVGTHFDAGSIVDFDGIAYGGGDFSMNGKVVDSATHIYYTNVIVSPNTVPGKRDINIRTQQGGFPPTWEIPAPLVNGLLVIGNAPAITNVSPMTGRVTDQITITGTEFGDDRVEVGGQVFFNGTSPEDADYVSWTNTQIQVKVPQGATTGPLTVVTPGGTSNPVNFNVRWPTIENMSPDHGKAGQPITITGNYFGDSRGTGYVTFANNKKVTAASQYTNWDDESITVKVPSGAQTGGVTVTTNDGDMSNAFAFTLDSPNITSISPSSGNVGTKVTINGSHFDNYGGSHGTVSFTGADVDPNGGYVSRSDTKMEVYVPDGTSDGPVVVKNSTGTSNGKEFDYTGPAPDPYCPSITSITPTSGAVGALVTINGDKFGASRINPNTDYVTFNDTMAYDYTYWSDGVIKAKVPSGATSGLVKVSTADGTSGGRMFTVTTPPPVPTKLSPTWYLAEGSSDWGFETYVTIMNPNNTGVTAQVTYMTPEGPVTRADIGLPSYSQTTLNPRNDLGSEDFSTRVVCKEGKAIAVDRRMIWTGPGSASPEGHASIGVTGTSKTWYLAEGSSKWEFETWLLLQNPGGTAANCTVTYMIEGGDPVDVTKTVPANSRASFNIADDIGAADASMKVVSNQNVIAERAMYRHDRREGHDSVGTTAPACDYFLPEGTTDWGFTTYVLVQNPNTSEAEVTITYMTEDGPEQMESFTMPATSRKTIKVNDQMPAVDLSTQVHGDLPIIAERAMYWDSGLGEACHDSVGINEKHSKWYLPDGETYNGYETFTLVQNPNDEAVEITVKYMKPEGEDNVTFDAEVPANSRVTFNMSDHLGLGKGSVQVTCNTAGKKIIVERAMYWSGRGAGTDTIGSYSD